MNNPIWKIFNHTDNIHFKRVFFMLLVQRVAMWKDSHVLLNEESFWRLVNEGTMNAGASQLDVYGQSAMLLPALSSG